MRYLGLLLFLLLIFQNKPAYACSCGGNSDLNASFQSATSVSIIRVVRTSIIEEESYATNIKTGKRSEHTVEYVEAVGNVTETLKGTRLQSVTMTGQTPNQGCYEFIETGAYYLVFTDEIGKTSYTSCSNNQPLFRVPEKLLKSWRSK